MCAARHPDLIPQASGTLGTALLERLNTAGRGPAPQEPPDGRIERRLYQRLPMALPLRLVRVAGQVVSGARLVTRDVSSSGVRFEAPFPMEPDTPIELEIELLDGPLGGRRLQMLVDAHIVRVDGLAPEDGGFGWTEFAASFDEIRFHREDAEMAVAHSDAAAD